MKYILLTAINRWVSRHIVKASATQNVEDEHVGVLNKIFSWLYEIHLAGQRVKQCNRKVNYALKYALVIAVVGLVVTSAIR
jgi:beta-hydroxylase